MREEQLQAIKERFEKATPGPWRDSRIGIVNEQGHDVLWATISEEVGAHKYDLDFILNSIRDIPALITEVERLREALEFYADDENWLPSIDMPFEVDDYCSEIDLDKGKLARQALDGE